MPYIVFVFPPIPKKYIFTHHLGAAYVRSYLQEHGIESAQFVTSGEETAPDIVAEMLGYRPEIVGFTCYDANYAYVRILAKMLKKKNPDITIILGGPTATFSANEIMNHTREIDLCVRGEGEKTVLELVQKGCKDLESIRGITYRSGDKLASTPERPFISSGKKGAELDVLPSPYLTGLIPPDGKTGILTSRGCIYRCTYCNFSTMFSHTIRYHSVERVIKELRLIYDHRDPENKENVMIHDDVFSLNLKRAKAICQKIIDENINLPLFLETRADNCDKELIDLMKEAGVHQINLGLESASPKVLRTVKKAPGKEKAFLNQVKKCVSWAKEAGMTTSVSVIFGLPGEDMKEAEKTLKFVEELNVDEYYHNVLFLFAGTELFSSREKYDLDVYYSPSFLPYFTKYAYDVTQMTPLPHATLHQQLKSFKKMYCDLLSYERGTKYKYLVIRKMPGDTERLTEWLQKLCVLHLSVFDITLRNREEVAQRREALLSNGVPVGFYSLVLGNGPYRKLRLSTYTDLDIPVPEIPFHQFDRSALAVIENERDARALAHFFDTHTREGILSFSSQEIPRTVVDSCKWGENQCSAGARNTLVINGDAVLSCYQGGCTGKVGDTAEILQQNVKRIIHETEEKRGCRDCSVKNKCSRCLFPFPFPETEFCRLKRKFPYISTLITLLEWLHFFSEDRDGTLLLRTDEKAPPLFYHGHLSKGDLPHVCEPVYLFSFNGKAFAFCAVQKSFSLDPSLAAILEACQLKTDRKSVLSYLCESEGMDTEEASKALSRQLLVLEVAGFLKLDK